MSDKEDSKRIYKAVSLSGESYSIELEEFEGEQLSPAAHNAGEEPETVLAMLRQRLGEEAVEVVDEVVTEEIRDFRKAKIERVEAEAEEIRAEAERELEEAREEAAKIKQHAREKAGEIVEQGKEKLGDEIEQAKQEAAEQARRELKQREAELLEKLSGVPERVEAEVESKLDGIDRQLAELGLEVGEVLAAAELERDPERMARVICSEMDYLEDEDRVRLELSERIHAKLEDSGELDRLCEFLAERHEKISVEVDPELEGGFAVSGPNLRVDRSHGRILDELRARLGLKDGTREQRAAEEPEDGEPEARKASV